jgi:hypothetical protein
MLFFVHFKNVGMPYSRAGDGAIVLPMLHQNFTGSMNRINMMRLRNTDICDKIASSSR